MPISQTEITAFENLGWQICRDAAGDTVLRRVLGEDYVEVLYQSFQREDTIWLPLLVRASNLRFKDIFIQLTARKRSEHALFKKVMAFQYSATDDAPVEEISCAILDVVGAIDFAAMANSKVLARPEFIEDQFEYIAALAWAGMKPELLQERQMLEMTATATHGLHVDQEVLDRAIQITGMPI